MSNLAIIPARGGSKRIPGKNIRVFMGQPVIAFSIDSALKTGLFEEVMVSTDDHTIAEVAERYGARVPFMRSRENADDFATVADVAVEVILKYETLGKLFETVCIVLPTAPLTESRHIFEGYVKLTEGNYDSVCAVVTFSHPVQRAMEITAENRLRMIRPEFLKARSQDLTPVYHDSGSFVWVKKEALLREKTLLCRNCGAVVMAEADVQDIDTESDWQLAEMKYKLRHNIP